MNPFSQTEKYLNLTSFSFKFNPSDMSPRFRASVPNNHLLFTVWELKQKTRIKLMEYFLILKAIIFPSFAAFDSVGTFKSESNFSWIRDFKCYFS